MTVILAGLYDNGNGAILVSDKGRTIVTDGEVITSDRDDVSKIKKLNDNIYVLVAGARHITAPYVRDLEEIITADAKPSGILDKAAEIYKVYRDKDVANNILLHYNYTTLEEFKATSDISPTLAAVIDMDIRRHQTDFDFIIVGFEGRKYLVYGLVDPGYFVAVEDGFAVGGSKEGKICASGILLQDFRVTMNKDEAHALLIRAKNKACERDASVGTGTDVIELPQLI